MNRFFLLFGLITLMSCHVKTPEESAKEAFDRNMQKMEEERKAAIDRADSLYLTAAGHNRYALSKVRRVMALEQLKKEFPELNIDWDGIMESIRNGETYISK